MTCMKLPSTADKRDLRFAHKAEMISRRARQLNLSERLAARDLPRKLQREIFQHHSHKRENARRVRQMAARGE